MTDDLTLDRQLALRSAAARLAEEFTGQFGAETIERFLTSSYDEFADRSAVVGFLPLLAERFARQRLRALARVEKLHDGGRPVVLFLCTHNAGRSQMAAGFLAALSGGAVEVRSAGSMPADQINSVAVEAMTEVGIDIRSEQPKVLTTDAVEASDVVITMGCGDVCPVFPGVRYEDWQLDDPAGQGLDSVRPIREEIRTRVLALLDQLGVQPVQVVPSR